MKVEPNGRRTPESSNTLTSPCAGEGRTGSAVKPAVVAWVATGLLLAAEIVAVMIVAFPSRASAQEALPTTHGTRQGVVVDPVGALSLGRCTVPATGPVTRTRSFSEDFRQEVEKTTVTLYATC